MDEEQRSRASTAFTERLREDQMPIRREERHKIKIVYNDYGIPMVAMENTENEIEEAKHTLRRIWKESKLDETQWRTFIGEFRSFYSKEGYDDKAESLPEQIFSLGVLSEEQLAVFRHWGARGCTVETHCSRDRRDTFGEDHAGT